MTNRGKKNVLGVLVDAVDYDAAVARIVTAAETHAPLGVTALAVHGVMTSVSDPVLRHRLNGLDLVVPDGQPVRWALNLLYGSRLDDQVRGTTLTLRLLEAAATEGLPVFFYGSRSDVLEAVVTRVRARFPRLQVAGADPSRFGSAQVDEQAAIAARISASGARIAFVGLGCPRQEMFVDGMRHQVGIPLVAVGAAFDYIAGTLRQPPERMRRAGFEWLWRLVLEPRRLWRRYVLLNPAYLVLLAAQRSRVWQPDTTGLPPAVNEPLPV